jgi:hypothetical protein
MKVGIDLAQREIQRVVSCTGTINVSPHIRGELLKGDDVLLTLTDGGILISPYREGEVREQTYSVKAKFSVGRLYLPVRFLNEANIKRWITIKIQSNGNLLLVPGERCMICGSRKDLYSYNADQQICWGCLKRAYQSKMGG